MPLIYNKDFACLKREINQLFQGDHSPLSKLILSCARTIGEGGNKLRWNEEQGALLFWGQH